VGFYTIAHILCKIVKMKGFCLFCGFFPMLIN
jgi:hypothetical protein